MAFERISRKGQKLVSSTLYVPKDTDDAYVNAATTKRKKSKLMVDTLVANAPKK